LEGASLPVDFFWNFQVKNAGFYAFLSGKNTCGRKPRAGGLIEPLEVEDVKRIGVKNFAGG